MGISDTDGAAASPKSATATLPTVEITAHRKTVKAPTGYAEFPKEILRPPRSLAEKTYGKVAPRSEIGPRMRKSNALPRIC